MSISCLKTLQAIGEDQSVTMYDQFCPSNYTEVVLRVSNANTFANHTSSVINSSQFGDRPLITFSKSHLWSMDVLDQEINNVTNSIQEKITKYAMKAPPGGDSFVCGQTRLEKALLFVSLCLGTPAYVFVPFLHQRRGTAGNSAARSSNRERLPSECFVPTTRS